MKALVFTSTGTAVLEDEDGKALWSSDADEDFAETNPNEFLGDEDADEIINYLADVGLVSDEEDIDVYEDDDDGENDELGGDDEDDEHDNE